MPTRLLVLAATMMAGGMIGAFAGNAAVAGMQVPEIGYSLPLAGDEQVAMTGLREEIGGDGADYFAGPDGDAERDVMAAFSNTEDCSDTRTENKDVCPPGDSPA